MKRFFIVGLLAYSKVPLLMAATTVASPVTSPVSNTTNLVQMLLGLLVIIGLIFVVVWLIKRVGVMNYSGVGLMKIKSCLPLSTKEKVVLIEIGDEQLLIGVAPGFVGLIKSLDKPINMSAQEPPLSSLFAEKLKAVLMKGETTE